MPFISWEGQKAGAVISLGHTYLYEIIIFFLVSVFFSSDMVGDGLGMLSPVYREKWARGVGNVAGGSLSFP